MLPRFINAHLLRSGSFPKVRTNAQKKAYYIKVNEGIHYDIPQETYRVIPAVYLSSDVQVLTGSGLGDGTTGSPFLLAK